MCVARAALYRKAGELEKEGDEVVDFEPIVVRGTYGRESPVINKAAGKRGEGNVGRRDKREPDVVVNKRKEGEKAGRTAGLISEGMIYGCLKYKYSFIITMLYTKRTTDVIIFHWLYIRYFLVYYV